MKHTVTIKMQALSGIDILSIIPGDTLAEIKKTNEHPYFQAYSICHEGTSNPRILGDNAKPIHWTRKAIQSIKNVLTKGVKFFKGHNEDNSTEGRKALGEIVADTQMEIEGTLHHVVVGYFPDKEAVKDMDICSQESEWNLLETAKNFVADTVEAITGIALGNSDKETQAFSGAKRLALLQAFEDNKDNAGDAPGEGKGETKMDLNTIPLAELKAAVMTRGLHPSQLFAIESIETDREFKAFFDERDELKKQLADKDVKIKGLEDDKDALGKKINLTTAPSRLDKMLTEAGDYTDKQKAFIKKSFDGADTDLTDDGIKKFIETKLNDYKTLAEVLDVSGELKIDTGPSDSNLEAERDDMTSASNNELLSEDYTEG